jgi:predicted RNA-binding protein
MSPIPVIITVIVLFLLYHTRFLEAFSNYSKTVWKQMPGHLKQAQHDQNIVCGVNRYDDIYCADKDIFNNPNWFNVPGKLKHVAVSNGKLYGANSNDDIWYNDNYRSGNWKQIGGKLKQVDIDGNTVCGVNSIDDIYCKDNLDGSNWFQVPGKLKHVATSKGKLYGANSNDDIWYNDNYRSGNWKQIGGKLKQVDIDGNTVCGVNSGNQIFCKDDLVSSNWTQLPGSLKYVSVHNKNPYGVNSGDNIYSSVQQTDFDYMNRPHEATLNYDQMREVCNKKGMKMCSSRDLCKNGAPLANLDIFGSSDNWIAVNDRYNEWLTFNRWDNRLCKTHSQLGAVPAWGTSNQPSGWARAVKCCPTGISDSPNSPFNVSFIKDHYQLSMPK